MATPTMDKLEALENDSTSSHLITVTFRIRRFNPEISADAVWEDFQLEIDPKERVLDGLHKIKWELDGSLTFRRSCAHGICGSDAMRINGKNRLACKTLIKRHQPEKPITVEAIKGLTVLKDLVVDMDPFFQAYRDVMPFLVTKGNEPTRERLQSAEDRERFDDTTKRILCAACTSSCLGVLERRPVLRSCRDRERPPLHLRLARRGRGAAPGDPQRPVTVCGAAAPPSTARTPARVRIEVTKAIQEASAR